MKHKVFNIKSLALLTVGIFLLAASLFLPAGTTVSGADEVKPEEPVPESPPPANEEHGLGYNPRLTDLPQINGDSFPAPALFRTMLRDAPPSSFDWRTSGKVTSVRNQGSCGSCYAFATIGNLESKVLIDSSTILDLSENNAKECNATEVLLSQNDATPNDTWNNCDRGGDATMVINLFTQKGAVLESCDPYVAGDVSCNSVCTPVKTVLDWRIISHKAVANTATLKQYIQSYGPVFTSLFVGDPSTDPAFLSAFQSYNGSYTIYKTTTEPPNHGVLIVGWDDSLNHAGGTGGWIVKNSWGTGWGASGYFTIAYGSARIGYDSSVITTIQDYDLNGGLLFYDEGGITGSITAYTDTLWGLVKYIPASNTSVTRVEFWTTDVTTDVDIYLYNDFNPTTETLSNLLAQKLDQSFPEAGYHSITLDTPLPITSGNDVYVAVKFTKAGGEYAIAVDKYKLSSNPLIYGAPLKGVGYCYLSQNGNVGSWTDVTSLDVELQGDLGIRLRTSSVPVANFTASPTTTTIGSTVTFTDTSTGTITGWSWNFGDGQTSTLQNPTHQYAGAGTFNVSLTVTGPGGTDIETKNGYITITAPALDHVTVSPARAYVLPSATQQFTATGYDQYNNIISGLSWSWSVLNPQAGSINSGGSFTAGTDRGTFLNTVQAEASYGGNTRQGTATVLVGASMTVTATLQGNGRTEAGMNVPFTLKLYSEAVTIGNILTLVPIDTGIFTTTAGDIEITGKNTSTKVVTIKVGRLPTGTYHITLFTPHSLVNYKASVSIPPGETVNMGALLEGDAQDITESSTSINITDFNRFAQAYETVPGNLKWDARADFNEDDYINLSDFTLLYTNYGKTSPQTVTD